MAHIMTRATLIIILLVLGVLGLVDSIYLAGHATADTALFCDIGAGLDGCNTVAQSPYSKFYGIPLAYFGVAYYALLALLALIVAFRPLKLIYKGLLAYAVVGAVASVVFLFIQFVFIKALCIYCIASAIIAFLALFASFILFKRFAPKPPAVIA